MTPHRRKFSLYRYWPSIIVAVLIVLSLIAAFVTVFNVERVDLYEAWDIASREMRSSLSYNEKVEVSANVYMRMPTNYYRKTPGILAISNRRLIFVGVEAKDKLAGPDAPTPIVTYEFTLDTNTSVRRKRLELLTRNGISIADSDRVLSVAEYADENHKIDSIATIARRAQDSIRKVSAYELSLRQRIDTMLSTPLYYRIKRGDALISISNKFGTNPDSLKSWNSLTSDRIRIGDTLLVKPGILK